MGALRILAAAFALSLVWGCGPKYIEISSSPTLERNPPGRIAILPMIVDDGPERGGKTIMSGKVEADGPGVVTDLLYHKLEHYTGLDLVPRDRVKSVAERAVAGQPDLSLTERAKRAGEELNAPEVLAGRVTRYAERVGHAYGIERPPSVGFDLLLVDTSSGTVLWKGSYFETQQSLFSDLSTFPLFIKRGGKWQTARQLAEYGVLELLSDPIWERAK
jgi:hypothetical protein